jgi:hypothetical protein
MSNTDKKDPTLQPEPPAEEILDDLESIKELLDEEEARLAEESGEAPVPLLDDLIDGGLTLEEQDYEVVRSTLTDEPSPETESRLDNDLIDTLLGDEWKRAASDLLTQARGAIEANRNQWTPEHTDELNEALRVRIDATLSAWLRTKIRDHMDELHSELLHAAETAIIDRIALLTEEQESGDEGAHGG